MTELCQHCGERPSMVGFEEMGKVEWLCLSCYEQALHAIGRRIASITVESKPVPLAEADACRHGNDAALCERCDLEAEYAKPEYRDDYDNYVVADDEEEQS